MRHIKGRRRDYNLFVGAVAETSDAGAEAVKPDTRCSLQGHSRRVGADVGNESAESPSVVQPLRISSVICQERHTFVVVVR